VAYGKLIIFELKKSFDDETIERVDFDNCTWGWFIKDNELNKVIVDWEQEYQAMLSPEEMIRRFEANKLEFDKSKTANDRYVKWYLETTEKPDMEFLKSRKKDYLIFERLVYDRRLIRVNFHKYWWESGMN
jgi:hypothetical protein